MKPARISIVTIALNNPDGLMRTLSSCQELRQHLKEDVEHLVIDSSPGVHRGVRQSFPEVIFFESEPKGVYYALNEGNQRARGSIIWHLHSGDELLSCSRFLEALDAIEASGADILFSPMLRVGSTGSRFSFGLRKDFRSNLIWGNGAEHPGCLFKRGLFLIIGSFDTSYQIAGDIEFWVRAVAKSRRFIFFPHHFVLFEPGGLSQSAQLRSLEEFNRAMAGLNMHIAERALVRMRLGFHLIRLKSVRPLLRRVGIYDWVHGRIENFKRWQFKVRDRTRS